MKKIAAFIPLLLTTNVFANDSFGAMEVYSQAPFHSASLTPKLRNPVQPQRAEVFASLSAGSMWIESQHYKMDYYQNQINVGGRFQVNPRLNVELKYQWLNAKDNGLDPITYAFHELFRIGQNGRDEVEYGEYTIETPYNNFYDFEGSNIGQNFSVYFDYALFARGNSAISVGGTLYYGQSDDDFFKHTAFDQAVQLNYGFVAQRFQFYSTIGMSLNHVDGLDIEEEYKKIRFNGALGFNYAVAPNHRLIMETTISQGALKESETSDEFSKKVFEFTLGYRYLWRNMAFELAMIENYINMDNSADIAFTGGVRAQF